MSEISEQQKRKLQERAEKINEMAKKLADKVRTAPLELARKVLMPVKEGELWKYMKTTYTAGDQWAEDVGIARSTYFEHTHVATELKDLSDDDWYKFPCFANARWFAKLTRNLRTPEMLRKAQTMKAEDFEKQVQDAQRSAGHTVSDTRGTLKIRMYSDPLSFTLETLKMFAIKNDLDQDDPGYVMEMMMAEVRLLIDEGESVVAKIRGAMRFAAFELSQANSIFASDKAAAEQLEELHKTIQSVTVKLAEAAGMKLPEAKPRQQSETRTAPKASAAAAGAGTEKKTLSSKELASMRVM